jgi:hypothetical protein
MCNLTWNNFRLDNNCRNSVKQMSTTRKMRSSSSCQGSQRSKSRKQVELHKKRRQTSKSSYHSKLEEEMSTIYRTCTRKLGSG